jgi:hypothetical protein
MPTTMAKRSMFVGMDVHKESIDVSLAEEGLSRWRRFQFARRNTSSLSS